MKGRIEDVGKGERDSQGERKEEKGFLSSEIFSQLTLIAEECEYRISALNCLIKVSAL